MSKQGYPSVEITLKDIKQLPGISPQVLSDFARYHKGVYKCQEYDLDEQMDLLTGTLGPCWIELCKAKLVPEYSMAGIDLSEYDLEGCGFNEY